MRTGRQWVYDESDYQLLVSSEPPAATGSSSVVWRRISDFTEGHGDDCAMLRGSTLQAGLKQVVAELDRRREKGGKHATAHRLRRWPPLAVLGRDARLSRLATLLISRPMTIRELSSVSGLSLGECEEFVSHLDGAALLDHSRPERTASAENGTNRGLFSMIRKRLGIDRQAL
ncbi:MAG: hypothetical protein GVY11_04565 [Gammaproteobacteria bacterium]|nr:hypothetical protein [Gammaproteobacteria bacterium]